MVQEVIPNLFSRTIIDILPVVLFYAIPIIVILVSGYYQYKNPNIKGYAKSLLIPIAYIVLGFFGMALYKHLANLDAEGSAFLVVLCMIQFAITFSAVAIINLVIFLIKR